MPQVRYAFDNVSHEHSFVPLKVEGTLPSDLHGTFLCNGPGLSAPFGTRYRHWFDGDGAVRGVRFAAGQAYGAARVIDSIGLRRERAAGRHLYDVYGTSHASFWQRLRGTGSKNVANTSLLFWQEQLYALVESSLPTQMRHEDLSTVGESSLGGVLRGAFSAHPHRVPTRQAYYNFGITHGRQPQLELYELPDAGSARHMGSLPLRFGTMIHDFIATHRYLIFFVAPLKMRLWPYLIGKSFADALTWEPQLGTEVLVVPIDRPTQVVRFTTEPFFQWHFSNAFERDDDIMIDFVRYDNFASNASFIDRANGSTSPSPLAHYVRATLDLRQQSLTHDAPLLAACEFPQIAERERGHDAAFAYTVQFASTGLSAGLPHGFAKIHLQTGRVETINLGDEHMPSEALFVPRSAAAQQPDDGYLVSLVLDSRAARTYAVVIDARHFDAGPIAKIWFEQPLPLTFHGTFIAAPLPLYTKPEKTAFHTGVL